MKGAVVVGLATVFLALPFVPGLVELLRRRDDQPLPIDVEYRRDPRYFGRAFRDKLAPHLEDLPAELPVRLEVQLRDPETVSVHEQLVIPDGESEAGIVVVLGDAHIGGRVQLRELYVLGDAEIGAGTEARGVACDGDLSLGQGTRIDRWVDVEGNLKVGRSCDLGHSASAALALQLQSGCTFRRLWGRPIGVVPLEQGPTGADTTGMAEQELVWARDRLSLPPGMVLERDVVCYGDVHIGAGATLRGTVKAYGDIRVDPGATVAGNLFSRKDVVVAGGAKLRGDVFSEGEVALGPGTQVGRRGGTKTLYTSGELRIWPGVVILGAVIAEGGGSVEEGAGP